jgi:hypothetical protein
LTAPKNQWFRSRGVFVGIGVAGTRRKAVIGQRLKQSGMHCTVNGADAIITLRGAEVSSQWEASYNTFATRQESREPNRRPKMIFVT